LVERRGDSVSFYDDEAIDKNKESQKEYKNRRDRERDDLKTVLKKPEGRRVIWGILETCGVFKSSFALNSMQGAFNEGKRDIGLALLADLNEAEPQMFAQMQSEYISELKSKKQVKEAKDE
jgi:hypothetical protein